MIQTRITQTISGYLVIILLQYRKLIQGFDFTGPLMSRDQVPLPRRLSLHLEATHCAQLRGIPVSSSGHPDYVKKGIYTMGINEFSQGFTQSTYFLLKGLEHFRNLFCFQYRVGLEIFWCSLTYVQFGSLPIVLLLLISNATLH